MNKIIPKQVFLSWKTKDIINSNLDIIIHGVGSFIDLNPDWVVTVYGDEEVDGYLRDTLDLKDYKLIENIHIVAKTDIWRLFKMYLEGGMYMDIDRLCNKSISSLIGEGIKWVLPTCREFDFSHDLMISAPTNPVFLKTIELYFQRKREGSNNTYFLGAQTYMHAITETLFGRVINTNPGIEIFKQIRRELDKISFIKTFREDPPYSTFLFNKEDTNLNMEDMKRDLYKKSSIKHWTGEW